MYNSFTSLLGDTGHVFKPDKWRLLPIHKKIEMIHVRSLSLAQYLA